MYNSSKKKRLSVRYKASDKWVNKGIILNIASLVLMMNSSKFYHIWMKNVSKSQSLRGFFSHGERNSVVEEYFISVYTSGFKVAS